jgi:hypothetical protein
VLWEARGYLHDAASRRVRRGHGLGDARHLAARADDLLPGRVADERDVLVLPLGALPDLDLAAPAEHPHAHRREEVVGGVGVVVDAAVEDGGGVLADARRDHGPSAGVVLDKVAHVVDHACHGHQRPAVPGFGLVGVPVDDGQLLQGDPPVERLSLLVELLLELLEPALLDLILLELLEVVGQTELLPDPDGPLRGVVLMPLDGIAVIRWELVVEVVVALAEGDEGGDHVVPGGVAVVEGLVPEPVRQGVDAEGGLLDEEDAEDARVDEAAPPVAPAQAGDEAGEDHAHEDDGLEVVAVLEDDDGVIVQVGDVGAADALRILLHDHPAKVGVEEALADRVGVLVGVGIPVVRAVVPGPPADGALDGAAAHGREEDLEGGGR